MRNIMIAGLSVHPLLSIPTEKYFQFFTKITRQHLIASFFLLVTLTILSCGTDHPDREIADNENLPAESRTIYSETTELFVDFQPLIVGDSSQLITHITVLGGNFKPLQEGTASVKLIMDALQLEQTVIAKSPGMFIFSVRPKTAGLGKLVFDIKSKEVNEQFTIDSVHIFEDRERARNYMASVDNETYLSFFKEQSWKIDFASQKIEAQIFHNVIKATGQLTAKPSDEQVVTSRSSGVVLFNDELVVGSRLQKGQRMFRITSGNLTQGNIESAYQEAKSNYEKAKADLDRVEPLLRDKIISQKDYLEIRNNFDRSKIAFDAMNQNYANGGQSVDAPINGYIKTLLVQAGEYVTAGQPIAVLSRDQSLQLKAEVPLRYANDLPLITEAQFKTVHHETVYNTRDLNGKVISYGKSIGDEASLLPIYLSLTNDGTLIPGDVVEVFLKTKPIQNALVIPVSSLIEEQGNFFVFVQQGGESFEKRLIKTGANDGKFVQVILGLRDGERVVTKGAQMIRLATQSGALPEHGHEH